MEKIKAFFEVIDSIEQVQIVFKIVLITILAGILGRERETWKKPAGFRTYMLVGICGVLVTLADQKLHEVYGSDAARISAQLVCGIGFLGAGTILRDGFQVKGLTTAAGLLSIACIGLVVGTGSYFGAIFATVIVYCVLSFSHLIQNTAGDFNTLCVKVTTDSPRNVSEGLRKIFDSAKIEIADLKICEGEAIIINCKSVEKINQNNLFANVMKIDNVNGISVIENGVISE